MWSRCLQVYHETSTRLSPMNCEPFPTGGGRGRMILMTVDGTRGIEAALASTPPPLLERMNELARQVREEAECFFDCYNCSKLDT